MKRLLALPLVVVFCTPPDLGTDAAAQACSAYAVAYCGYLQSCSQTFFNLRFASLDTCQQYETTECVNAVIAPKSGSTPSSVSACTTALPTWACRDFIDDIHPPMACAPIPGGLPNGASCAKNQQCESTFCDTAPGSACGTCAPVPPPGTPCGPMAQVSSCGPGNYCNDQSVCTPHALLGQACSKDNTCASGYACTGSVCVQGLAQEGAPCGLTGDVGCDIVSGLDCNEQRQSCQPAIFVGAGQACDSILFGQQTTHCSGGAQCLNGACSAVVGLGQACDTVAGPTCVTPARCINQGDGGTAGTCVITDATFCN